MLLSTLLHKSKDESGSWQLMIGVTPGCGCIQCEVIKSELLDNGQIMLTLSKECIGKDSFETNACTSPMEFLPSKTSMVVDNIETYESSCGLWLAGENLFLVPAGSEHRVNMN